MDLNDLLSDIDGLGADSYIPSRAASTPAPADDTPADVPAPAPEPTPDAPGITMEQLFAVPTPPPAPALGSLEMVLDVELDLLVELGTTRITLRDLMRLQPGDPLLLDQRPDEPVTIFVNDRPVAQGEVFVINGSLAVKVVHILTTPTAAESK